VLQFTLPGSPNLYYGTELDMPGGDDPEMRAPMRWDLVKPDNAVLAWNKRLIALHKDNRALRVGNWRAITAGRLMGFERYTDRAADTVVVLLNPTEQPVTDTVLVANSKLMDGSRMVNLLADQSDPATPADVRLFAALMHVTLPAHGFAVLKPDVAPPGGYTNYKRVQ
jgi:glycosidase